MPSVRIAIKNIKKISIPFSSETNIEIFIPILFSFKTFFIPVFVPWN